MPRFDGTGPMGQGPLTGRGMGYCAVPFSDSSGQPGLRVGATPAPGLFHPLQSIPFTPRVSRVIPRRGVATAGRGRGFRHGVSRRRGLFWLGEQGIYP